MEEKKLTRIEEKLYSIRDMISQARYKLAPVLAKPMGVEKIQEDKLTSVNKKSTVSELLDSNIKDLESLLNDVVDM